MGGFGGPSGSSGTGTGSTANVYTPYNQPNADFNYNQILQGFINAGAAGLPSTNPAGTAYPIAQQYGIPAAEQQFAGANQVYNTAFDPQNALFQQGQQRVLDQSNAANAAAGLGSSPYGAGVTGGNLSNFDVNWQNQQLARQAQGLQAAGAAGTTGLGDIGNVANLGQSAFLLPQQTENDLQSYLGIGQSASQLSGELGQMGVNQETQALSGIGSMLGLLSGGGAASTAAATATPAATTSGGLGGLGSLAAS